MRQYPFPLGIIIISLFVCCHQRSNKTNQASASGEDQKLSVKDMKADLAVLWSAVKELHPGYGLYTSTDSMAASYNAVFSAVNAPMYEEEFISKMYPFLCTLGCGHTQLRHSAAYQSSTGRSTPHLPFEVLVRHQRVWVTTRKTAKLATGDEIISINDTPVSAIIQKGYWLLRWISI